MSKIDYNLKAIKGVIFDVDGVLSPSTIPLGDDGMPCRMINIKDGYALQLAVKQGLHIAIVTGADSQAIINRYSSLGITDIYTKVTYKEPIVKAWIEQRGLKPEQVAFAGDDIPDMPAMKIVGLPIAPADACSDIKLIARYISKVKGGYGVARDIIEEILKAQKLWLADNKAFGW